MNPVIDGIVAAPSTVGPGGSFVVTITAHDADSKQGILTGVVRDGAGNESRATVVVTVSDPLSYELRDDAGAGFTITPRAGQPGVFDCVAP